VFFGRFGGLSANLLVGSLMLGMLQLPWRTAVYIMAAIGIAHAALFAVVFRNSPRSHSAVNEAEASLIDGRTSADWGGAAAEPRLGFREMLGRMNRRSIANLLALNVQTILSTLADSIYSAWIPLFLAEVHGLNFKEMGIYSALPLLGGALGGAIGGWLNDWMITVTGNRRWSRSFVGMSGKAIAAALLVAALLAYDWPRMFCVTLFFVKLFSDSSLTTTWGVVTDIGGRTSATVFAFNNSVAGIGSIVGPALFGFVAHHYGWVPVFVTAAVTYFCCAASWLLINSTLPIIPEEPGSDDRRAGRGQTDG
jgi:MFS family permease